MFVLAPWRDGGEIVGVMSNRVKECSPYRADGMPADGMPEHSYYNELRKQDFFFHYAWFNTITHLILLAVCLRCAALDIRTFVKN